ncbi:MAG TPA: hypothetical protein VKB75_10105 [Jatrophihabitans sp.]|nr:hypothetical protein [Jatrophihabitans sp.]
MATIAVPGVAADKPAQAATTSRFSSREQRMRALQLALFTVGALLMPLGIFAIFLGWYGVAHTKYQYDQLPYVVSGGLLGLALVFLGGFLYFGAWLAKIGNEQRESSRQLADAMLVLADVVERQRAGGGTGRSTSSGPVARDELVLAGAGSTVHRHDCPLIAHRDDLHPVQGSETGLGTCRVCRPDYI